MDILNKWCVEYSFKQNAVHVAPLLEVLLQNRKAVEQREEHDFIFVGIYSDKDYADFKAAQIAEEKNATILYTDDSGNIIIKQK